MEAGAERLWYALSQRFTMARPIRSGMRRCGERKRARGTHILATRSPYSWPHLLRMPQTDADLGDSGLGETRTEQSTVRDEDAHRAALIKCGAQSWGVTRTSWTARSNVRMYGSRSRSPTEEWPARFGVGGAMWIIASNPYTTRNRKKPRFQAMLERTQARIDQAAGTGDPSWGDWLMSHRIWNLGVPAQ